MQCAEGMVRGEGRISDDVFSRFNCAKPRSHTNASINREDWLAFLCQSNQALQQIGF